MTFYPISARIGGLFYYSMPKRQKTIVVIYSGDDWKEKQPSMSDDSRHAFEYWHTHGLGHGVAVYRACIKWYNEEKHHFTKTWCFRDGAWKKVKGPIVPDMVYDKVASKHDYALHELKLRMAKHTKMFNHPDFRILCGNKLSQYLLFSPFMPISFMVHTREELKKALSKIKVERAVLKPVYGSGGVGITIDTKEKIMKKKLIFPLLLQEFIDGSNGIPGNKKKALMDLRIVFVNHKPIYALSRTAKKNSFFTNFNQGAQTEIVPLRNIPSSVNAITKKIQHTLRVFPECQYCLDFIFTKKGKPVLMEMNTMPGLPGLDLAHLPKNEQIKKASLLSILSLVA